MAKTSIKAAVRDAVRADTKLRKSMLPDGSATVAATMDSFVNFAHKLGIGADNPLTSGTYGFNPITRNHVLLEWTHRGSWIAGRVVDSIADDMTREGIEYVNEMPPDQSAVLDRVVSAYGCAKKVNEVIKWGRLYGGCIGVLLIDGQDPRTELRIDTIAPGGFRGILPLDRWMLEPTTDNLVTELGAHLGMPSYYRVSANAPALRGCAIHHSRVVFRHDGIMLPYMQRLTENLWGISVLERLWDRMIAFDSASTGSAQLIYKAYLRTFKIKGLREIAAGSEAARNGLAAQMELMRKYQGIEGITMIDGEDEFEAQSHTAFSGLSDAVKGLAEQLSGAAEIPLTRLFGQSPGGLNATGDNDMRNYYDGIKQRQMTDLYSGWVTVHKCAAQSVGMKLPPDFAIRFKSLWQLTETDKASIAKSITETINSGLDAGTISPQTALREYRQSARITGVWTNITSELIEMADADVTAPTPDMQLNPLTGEPIKQPLDDEEGGTPPIPGAPQGAKQDDKQPVRPDGTPGAVGQSKERRIAVQPASAGSRPNGQDDH